MIYLLTGAIRSGKTTKVMQTISTSSATGGFLSPDQDGLRRLYFPSGNEWIDFQVSEDTTLASSEISSEILEVGRFKFLKNAFDEASQRSLLEAQSSQYKIIFLDEIGKLELKQKGFYELLLSLLRLPWKEKHLILFVRDYLLNEVIETFHLQEALVITKENIKEIL